MVKFLMRCFFWAMDIVAMVFTIAPESVFTKYKLFEKCPEDANIILNRILVIVAIFVAVMIVYKIIKLLQWRKTIKGYNYSIQVEYGDLFKKKGKKVIAFDECFTTEIGEIAPCIKTDSICGQFLQTHPAEYICNKIENANLQRAENILLFQNRIRYESGQLVPYDDEFLLMAFAKLNESGLGHMPTREAYLKCLSLLWEEIDKNYGSSDVCLTILGSGRTRMFDEPLTSQDLLDIMICSYKLSAHKIKLPHKLRIVCKRTDGISFDKVQ